MDAKEAWVLIQQIVPMHPNTLNKKVNKILKKLGHSSHDFRRTLIITNAHRKLHWKDVQQAAGPMPHQMMMLKYDQDDRQFSTEPELEINFFKKKWMTRPHLWRIVKTLVLAIKIKFHYNFGKCGSIAQLDRARPF